MSATSVGELATGLETVQMTRTMAIGGLEGAAATDAPLPEGEVPVVSVAPGVVGVRVEADLAPHAGGLSGQPVAVPVAAEVPPVHLPTTIEGGLAPGVTLHRRMATIELFL